MNLKLHLLVLFCTFATISYSQDQQIKAKFIIQDAKHDGVDITEQSISNGSYLAFYTTKGSDDVYFCNIMSKANTQSYGRIFEFDGGKQSESDAEYKHEKWKFRWSYINTYDERKGTAKVTIYKIYKPKGIAFKCVIVTENLDELEYNGYMEGSLKE